MTLIGLDYLKHQEQARTNRANEALKDRELVQKGSIADADRLSRENIALKDRESKESVASLDRLSKEGIAEADRLNNLEIAKLGNTNKLWTTGISSLGSGLLGAGIGAAGRIIAAGRKNPPNAAKKDDDDNNNTNPPPANGRAVHEALTFEDIYKILETKPELRREIREGVFNRKAVTSEEEQLYTAILSLFLGGEILSGLNLNLGGSTVPLPIGG